MPLYFYVIVCNSLPQLDRGSLSRVNSIDNITDFADLFGIQLPLSEEVDAHLRIAPRFGAAGGEEGTHQSFFFFLFFK